MISLKYVYNIQSIALKTVRR